MAFVLMPGVFLFDWIVLPLARARGLLPLAGVLALLALLAELGDLEILANVTAASFATLARISRSPSRSSLSGS